MRKDKLPEQLAIDLLPRSICNVRAAAVIVDKKGRIVSYGWNRSHLTGSDVGGICAEREAIRRSNRRRLRGATIYVAGQWRDSGNYVEARPCAICHALLVKHGIRKVRFTTKEGMWLESKL